MRRVPIRMKLAAALAVPLLGLFAFTVLEVVETTRQASAVRDQTDLARSGLGPAGVIATLQNERTWAVVDRVGMSALIQAPVVGYEDTRRQTNEAIATFRETVADGPLVVREAYGPALTALTELTALRDSIDADTAAPGFDNADFANGVFLDYTATIEPFLEASGAVALAVDDAELRQLTWLANLTTVQVETLADLSRQSILTFVLSRLEESSDIAPVATIRAVFEANNDRLLGVGPPYGAIVDEHYPRDLVGGLTDQIDAATAGETVDINEFAAPLNVAPNSGYMAMRQELVEALNQRADQLNADAAGRQRVYLALAALALAATTVLAWAVSRSITNPLRSLTHQAKAMADSELPDAVNGILDTPLGEDIDVPRPRTVAVQTRDEVSDVADALNKVQDTALDLAVEQAILRRNIADSFVNLGRRNQNLLSRQLDFITELEAAETDADTLSNLFRLDHLATRMRRNAESLLVLAGFAPSRQWAAPVRLADVIRAALSEVESYQRVVVEGVEPVGILGSVTADLAHLLAELIENALVFSPPDRQVRVHGRRDPGGDGYALAIVDSGLGMTAGDLAAANRRLAGAESFTIAPSKYLGHYVAGNLAVRHAIRARLQPSRGTGVTAIVELPEDLLTGIPVSGYTPAHGTPAIAAPPPADASPALPSASVFGDGTPEVSTPFAMRPGDSPPFGTPAVSTPFAARPGDSPPFGAPAMRSTPFAARWGDSPSHGTPVVPGAPADPSRGAIPVGPAAPGGWRPAAPEPPGPGGPGFRLPKVVHTGAVPAVPPPYDPLAAASAAPPPLARRVRGAQAPRTTVVPLRGDPAATAGVGEFDGVPRRAAEIRALLSDFTAGVQRGLNEARDGMSATRR
jgi:signal transduction histidine kinase